MRTRQLSVAIGCYSNGDWHVALTETTYERGRMTSSSVTANRWVSELDVETSILRALRHAMDMERARVEVERRRQSQMASHPAGKRPGGQPAP